jgi:hypothetical protein
MITLHELGHIQGMGHIDDAPDPGTSADWLDSVMHGVSRAKPKSGWNAHQYGPCDVAALQAAYQPATSSTAISTCHSLATTASVGAAWFVRLTARTVKFTGNARHLELGCPIQPLRGFPLSARDLTLPAQIARRRDMDHYRADEPDRDRRSVHAQPVTDHHLRLAVYPSAPHPNEGLVDDLSADHSRHGRRRARQRVPNSATQGAKH